MNDKTVPLKIIRDKAMQACSRKEYGSSEMLKKILSWGCPPDDAPSVINELVANKYLDDCRYATAYVNDRFRFGKWGRAKIGYMLRMQGIEESVIRNALESIDADEYLRCLKEELRKKRNSIKTAQPAEMQAKLFRFAASRGFETEVIYRALQ
ncbi:MAG: RecX family transcriptional regulator [Bacteroidales bacterium]|nr:RecX family transcriptional regulator [Bacteroidales bacterium]